MSETMRRLRFDHANLSRLLAALEREVVAMEQGGKPDWDIVERIVQYNLAFPDLHHHPLEDQLLAHLAMKDSAAAAALLGLLAEHRELSAALRRVAAATEQILRDATMPRDQFTGLFRTYLDAQRDHIRREEASFYPTVERAFDTADWVELDRIAVNRPGDPLFDKPTGRQFMTLLSDIKAGEAAAQRRSAAPLAS
jgi:hemerythrin-like domain-containing protein